MNPTEEFFGKTGEGEDGFQPEIIANHNIDPFDYDDFAAVYLGHPDSDNGKSLRKLLDDGWIVYRIHTEFHPTTGHYGVAYLAKPKSN